MLARGGEWIVASATVSGRDAIVLASRADRENGIAEVVLEAGGTLPVAGAAKPKKIQSIRFAKREEILWRK
jgi:hypothetical protein